MSLTSSTALRSALYEGIVTHRRSSPPHAFSTRVALPLLFLDELPSLRSVHPLVDLDPSPHRRPWPAAMRLRRRDYLPSDTDTDTDTGSLDSGSLLHAVTDLVAAAGRPVRGPVAMLGHVRTWGWLFNPVTLYYCFDPSGRHVETTVLEVSNTPWHERCRYVVGAPGMHRFAKEMHVSPFLPDAATYTLRYSAPSTRLRLSLDLEAPLVPAMREVPVPYGRWDEPVPELPTPALSASMVLRRHSLDRASLGRLLWSHPLMTTRVSAGIYTQALRLAARGAPFSGHPGHPRARGSCPVAPSPDARVLEHLHD